VTVAADDNVALNEFRKAVSSNVLMSVSVRVVVELTVTTDAMGVGSGVG